MAQKRPHELGSASVWLFEIILDPVHPLALDHADVADDLIAAAERMPTPVSLLWIANKAVQHTCEGKAAQAAICWCWCF